MHSPGDSGEDLAPPPVLHVGRPMLSRPVPSQNRGVEQVEEPQFLAHSFVDWLPLRKLLPPSISPPQADGRRLRALCAIASLIPHTHVLVSLRSSPQQTPATSAQSIEWVRSVLPTAAETEGLMQCVSITVHPSPQHQGAGDRRPQSDSSVSDLTAAISRSLLVEAGREGGHMSVGVGSAAEFKASLVAIQQICDILQHPTNTEEGEERQSITEFGCESLSAMFSSVGTLGARASNVGSSSALRRRPGVPVALAVLHTVDALTQELEAVLLEVMLYGTVTVAEVASGVAAQRSLGEGGADRVDAAIRHYSVAVPSVLVVALAGSTGLSSRLPLRLREAFGLSVSLCLPLAPRSASNATPLPLAKLLPALRMGYLVSSILFDRGGRVTCGPSVLRFIRDCVATLQFSTESFRHVFVGCMRNLRFYEHVARCAAYLWSTDIPTSFLLGGVDDVRRYAQLRRAGWERGCLPPNRPVVVARSDFLPLLPHLFAHLLEMDAVEFYLSQTDERALSATLDDVPSGPRYAAVESRVMQMLLDGGKARDVTVDLESMVSAAAWDAMAALTDSSRCGPWHATSQSNSSTTTTNDAAAAVLSHTEALNFLTHLVSTRCVFREG